MMSEKIPHEYFMSGQTSTDKILKGGVGRIGKGWRRDFSREDRWITVYRIKDFISQHAN